MIHDIKHRVKIHGLDNSISLNFPHLKVLDGSFLNYEIQTIKINKNRKITIIKMFDSSKLMCIKLNSIIGSKASNLI